jgi:hypothetical protein
MVMIMFCGFSVGAALGGLLAAALILLCLALGIRRRRRRAFAAGSDPGAAAAGIGAVPRSPGAHERVAHCSIHRPKARLRRQRSSSFMNRGWPEFRCCIFSGKADPGHAAVVGGVLHEPARSLFPVELAAYRAQ